MQIFLVLFVAWLLWISLNTICEKTLISQFILSITSQVIRKKNRNQKKILNHFSMTQKRFNLVMKALFDNFGNNIGVKVGDSFLETGVLFVSKFYRLTLSRLWGAYGLCRKSRARRARASPSEVYLAGKLQWHFTCGFDCGHSLCCHL